MLDSLECVVAYKIDDRCEYDYTPLKMLPLFAILAACVLTTLCDNGLLMNMLTLACFRDDFHRQYMAYASHCFGLCQYKN